MSSMKTKNDRRPKYWRSLAELEGDSEFQEFIQKEFPTPTEHLPLSSSGRRRFMQLMGASFALAGCRWKEEKILPHTKRPEGMIPGVPQHYATMMEIGGVATGLVVKSYDGRPIKVEGNPLDSVSRGGTSTYHQASILGLYDPERSTQALMGGKPSNNQAFDAALLTAFAASQARAGAGFVVLSQASSSPSLLELKASLQKQASDLRWIAYEAADAPGPREGSKLAFGRVLTTQLHPEKADVVVALDSDLLSGCA